MLVVARTPTPIAQTRFPGLIDTAFEMNLTPLRGLQRMMLAVLASIETARGRSVQNFNIGNITAGPNYEGAVWRPPWFDPAEAATSPRLAALHEAMLAGKAPSAFRAYANEVEGALDFARVVSRNFPEVLKAALVPNANAFRLALAQKYSKDYANPKATDGIAQLMKEYSITPSASAGGAVLLVVVALALFYFGKRPERYSRSNS